MAKIIDNDKGFKAIQKQLHALDGAYVKVGIMSGSVTKAQVKGQRVKKPGDSMVDIGFKNEFGAGRIPARPFIRSAFDEQISNIEKLMFNQYNLILQGKRTANQALKTIGVFVESEIKKKIRAIVTPPNAKITIMKKGSSKPLIDFGQLIQSIANVVIMRP